MITIRHYHGWSSVLALVLGLQSSFCGAAELPWQALPRTAKLSPAATKAPRTPRDVSAMGLLIYRTRLSSAEKALWKNLSTGASPEREFQIVYTSWMTNNAHTLERSIDCARQ